MPSAAETPVSILCPSSRLSDGISCSACGFPSPAPSWSKPRLWLGAHSCPRWASPPPPVPSVHSLDSGRPNGLPSVPVGQCLSHAHVLGPPMRTLAPGPEALWVCEGESPGAEGLGGWRARAGGSGALLSPLTCAVIPSGGSGLCLHVHTGSREYSPLLSSGNCLSQSLSSREGVQEPPKS